MRELSRTFLAVAILAAASPAAAAPAAKGAGVTGDVRCLVTMVALGSNKEQRQSAQVGVDFFAGRVSARTSAAVMADAIKAEAPLMRPADFQAEFKRCAPMVGAYTQSLQTALMGLRPATPPAAPALAAPPAQPH